MSKKKYLYMAAMLLVTAGMLSGCGSKKIFVNKNDAYTLVPYTDKELENEIYYIKSGADFYETYLPEGTAGNVSNTQADNRVFWLKEDESLIPVLYKNEVIAYQSEKTSLTDIVLERFKDIGYSVGLYGGTLDEDGFFDYSIQKNNVEGSDAYDALFDSPSDSIRVAFINDIPVTDSMLDSSGVITGLDKGAAYSLGYYAGTKYQTAATKADMHFLQSYEIQKVDKAYTTKNGYLAIYMPESAKSGYYMVNGKGLFLYYNFEKGEKDEASVDLNEPYYQTEEERIAAYSQQYMVTVKTKTNNVAFNLYYDTGTYSDDDITCVLAAPNGTTYNMVAQNGVAGIELAEVMAGRWTINVLPKDLMVNDIKVESTTATADASTDTKSFYIGEDDENLEFYAEYSGDGDIWGIVEYENGETQELVLNEKEKKLATTYSYVPAGTYTVTIYHYKDTNVDEIGYQVDTNNEQQEIITIEE